MSDVLNAADKVERIRADLELPCQSQFIRDDVRFLLAELERLREERDALQLAYEGAVGSVECAKAAVVAAERERDNWHSEYIEACKSLTKRVHQGAAAVHRAEAAERERDAAQAALQPFVDFLNPNALMQGEGWPRRFEEFQKTAREAIKYKEAAVRAGGNAALRELVEFAESMDGPDLRAWLVSQDAEGTPGSERAAYIVHHVLAAREALEPAGEQTP